MGLSNVGMGNINYIISNCIICMYFLLPLLGLADADHYIIIGTFTASPEETIQVSTNGERVHGSGSH